MSLREGGWGAAGSACVGIISCSNSETLDASIEQTHHRSSVSTSPVVCLTSKGVKDVKLKLDVLIWQPPCCGGVRETNCRGASARARDNVGCPAAK